MEFWVVWFELEMGSYYKHVKIMACSLFVLQSWWVVKGGLIWIHSTENSNSELKQFCWKQNLFSFVCGSFWQRPLPLVNVYFQYVWYPEGSFYISASSSFVRLSQLMQSRLLPPIWLVHMQIVHACTTMGPKWHQGPTCIHDLISTFGCPELRFDGHLYQTHCTLYIVDLIQ